MEARLVTHSMLFQHALWLGRVVTQPTGAVANALHLTVGLVCWLKVAQDSTDQERLTCAQRQRSLPLWC